MIVDATQEDIMFPKIQQMATPIKTDGGTKLGALIGAIIGTILAYGGVSSTIVQPAGTMTILAVMAGLIIGLVIGTAIGAIIDLRLTPKAKPGDEAQNDPKGG